MSQLSEVTTNRYFYVEDEMCAASFFEIETFRYRHDGHLNRNTKILLKRPPNKQPQVRINIVVVMMVF